MGGLLREAIIDLWEAYYVKLWLIDGRPTTWSYNWFMGGLLREAIIDLWEAYYVKL